MSAKGLIEDISEKVQKSLITFLPAGRQGLGTDYTDIVEALLLFTPLENPAIPACRQTGMAGMIKINNIHLRKEGSNSRPF